MIVRQETPDDFEAVFRVHREAFGRPDEARLVERLRAAEEFIPALSIVAEEDGQLIGHVILTRARLEDREVLTLGPLGVLPAWQNVGIGSALVRDALARTRALGAELIAVLGHPTYYPRFGFVPARSLGITSDYSEDAFMALELVPGSARGGGHIRYAAPFAESGSARER